MPQIGRGACANWSRNMYTKSEKLWKWGWMPNRRWNPSRLQDKAFVKNELKNCQCQFFGRGATVRGKPSKANQAFAHDDRSKNAMHSDKRLITYRNCHFQMSLTMISLQNALMTFSSMNHKVTEDSLFPSIEKSHRPGQRIKRLYLERYHREECWTISCIRGWKH